MTCSQDFFVNFVIRLKEKTNLKTKALAIKKQIKKIMLKFLFFFDLATHEIKFF